MTRSVWKGPFVDGYLLKKAEKVREGGRNEVIKIWSRRSTILPQFVGLTFGVYNGQKHVPVSRHRGHGRPQVRRVRSDPDLLRSRRGQEGEEEVTMGKAKAPRRLADNEARAVAAHDPHQPAEAEPGRRADPRQEGRDARSPIWSSRASASPATVKKTLESAIANAENNHDLDVDALVVAEAYVGKSIVMKRFHARGRGRASRIEKPFSHLTIVVREVEEKGEAA